MPKEIKEANAGKGGIKSGSSSNRPSAKERRQEGKLLRDKVSRESHALWDPSMRLRDPIEILEASNAGRIPELVPLRRGRMMKSPFAFYRGSAALMAADLSRTPNSGLITQICGDCHLMNFGGYATPERAIVVDINDFDETMQGPWEWDLKRLATSFVLAARQNGLKGDAGERAAEVVSQAYGTAMEEFSRMRALEVWYAKMALDNFIDGIKDIGTRKQAAALAKKQLSKQENYFPQITTREGDKFVFKEMPPLVFHSDEQRDPQFRALAKESLKEYHNSISEDRRLLLDRFEVMDIALKVVGIGSVGTYCAIILLMAAEDDPLILQVKEARSSVLEQYLEKSKHDNNGQRVVVGQRIMQAHSDIFLGWTKGPKGRHFFLRQLRDRKLSLMPESWNAARCIEVAKALGWVLARAHARSGDAAKISGYIGNSNTFHKAIAKFAVTYADQVESDHKVFVREISKGNLDAYIE